MQGKSRAVAPSHGGPALTCKLPLGEAIAHCLDGLPLTQRSVFVLREMEGVETEEVCKILEVTITNMGVLMHRARNRLRECLEGRGWRRTE